MMSLEQASYVAQIVGGAAVVASLVYVGFELRQNTAQLLRNEANAALGQNSAFRLAIATDRDVAQVWIQGLTGATPLAPADRLRFDFLLAEQLWISFHLWDRSRLGLSDKTQWSRGPVRGLAEILSTRGGGEWWARFKDRYPPAYASAIDHGLAAPPA
jgi:hypothetical protein